MREARFLGHYLLLPDHSTRPATDDEAMAQWKSWADAGPFEADHPKVVAKTDVDGVEVSTVFLGMDHSFGEGPPILFESMVFGGEHDQRMDRYATWDEAEAGHARIVAALKAGEDL